MSDQVSVRLAVVGGSQFRNELRTAGNDGARSLQMIASGARNLSPAFQEVALQASSMLAGMAGGNSALGGLAGGFARAAMSGGLFGLAGGVAVTAMSSLVPLLFSGGGAAAEMASKMNQAEASVGSLNGAVSALEGVQRAYLDAIKLQGGAASEAARLVVSNSKAEFEARKQVLGAEIEILQARSRREALELNEKQIAFREAGQEAMDTDMAAYGGLRRPGMPDPTGFAGRRQIGLPRATPNFDAFITENETTRAELRKAQAEATLTRLAIKETQDAMSTTFKDITTGAAGKDPGAGTGAGKGGGGGGAAVNKAVEEGKKIFEETRNAAERYAAQMAKLNDLLAQGAIDQETYNRKAATLRSEFDNANRFAQGVASQVKGSMTALFDSIVEGGGKAGDVIEGLGKKLLSMALQESAFRALAQLLPSTFGAEGFIPLLANANGNAFGGGRVIPFAAGGVVSSPTLFPMRGATGLMGEAGPEAIMPLTRIGGKLGVRAAGGGGGAGTVVNVINNSGQPAREERERGPNGEEVVRVIVGDQLAKGRHDGSMGRFGARPQKVRRG